jgi:hypothetical protein
VTGNKLGKEKKGLPLLVAGYRLDFGFQGLASGLEAFQRRVQMEFKTRLRISRSSLWAGGFPA